MTSVDHMIDTIQKKYRFHDSRVLSALGKIPREQFLQKKLRHLAYQDTPVSIGYEQTISQPYTVAFMTSLLSLKGTEKVLEIGTGSGYQTAVLSYLAKEVYSIEIIPQLAARATKTLSKLNISNVYIRVGSGEWGWKEHSPFDAIIVTAGIFGTPPETLFEQLRDKGTLVAPVGTGDKKEMTRYTKSGSKIKEEQFGSFQFVPFVLAD